MITRFRAPRRETRAVQYRSFPAIPDQKISVLGFGCMRLPIVGGDYTRIDEPLAARLLDQAIDAGVNYIDTAWPYHGGQSEVFLGRTLQHGRRAKVHLATKLPVWLVKAESDWERLLDQQRERLRSDTIDFYLLHGLNAERWETIRRLHGLEAVERARADGRIRYIGFSFHGSLPEFTSIIDGYAWQFCQVQYNLLDEQYQAGTEGVRYAASRQVGVAVMEPLRGGGLAQNLPDAVSAIWARHPMSRTPAQWALRWVWDHPEVVTALSGMNSERQLEENLAAADSARAGAMGANEFALVDEVRQYFRARTKVPCTTCGYCQPCPNGVAIADVFSAYNASAMFDAKQAAASAYRAFVVRAGHGADACLECGECEPKCPQTIPIPARLKEAHAHLVG
jgi:predicted aldo/keto reductase-like oxidoreductase